MNVSVILFNYVICLLIILIYVCNCNIDMSFSQMRVSRCCDLHCRLSANPCAVGASTEGRALVCLHSIIGLPINIRDVQAAWFAGDL
jgi:hypothetical protein